LAASDTLATAYALHKVILHLGVPDLMFCGLQTTDGDTAQVGPQIAERLDLPQTSYCEDFRVEGDRVIARRVIEGGYQWVKMAMPAMITVANSYHPLEYKHIRGARRVQQLLRDEEAKNAVIKVVTLDDVGADPVLCGLKGSPTIVAKTDKVSEIGGSCKVRQGEPIEHMVRDVLQTTNLKEFAKL
jgi:electron transfer flavoprotein beta subunit